MAGNKPSPYGVTREAQSRANSVSEWAHRIFLELETEFKSCYVPVSQVDKMRLVVEKLKSVESDLRYAANIIGEMLSEE